MSSSNTFMLGPIVAVLLLVPILILGLVLFIVGLVKKKPAMWGSGIAIGVLGLLILVVGAGFLAFVSIRPAPMRLATQMQQATASSMSKGFDEATGLSLPPDVSVTSRTETYCPGSNGLTPVIVFNMSVPADFDSFLAANFTKAKWSTVAPTFQTARESIESLPDDSQLSAASLYVLTYRPDPDLPEVFVTAVAHDTTAQQAWVLSVEEQAPEE